MEQEIKRLALASLDLMAGDKPDEELADALGSHESAAAGAAYLAGFAVQMLALHRGEEASATIRFLRAAISRDGDDGGAGVREPRRPLPSPGGASASPSEG